MPAVSGVWSCLHYPVPRGGFSPPGLGCFSVCVGLIVNPKCTRETTAVISPTLAPHYIMPSSLEKDSVWWWVPRHSEYLSAVPIPILFPTPPRVPLFFHLRVSARSQTAQMSRGEVPCWLHCSCHTAVWHSLCQGDGAYVQKLQTKSLQALHYLYQRKNSINLICLLGNCRLLCT